jgi:hypothetical protein
MGENRRSQRPFRIWRTASLLNDLFAVQTDRSGLKPDSIGFGLHKGIINQTPVRNLGLLGGNRDFQFRFRAFVGE